MKRILGVIVFSLFFVSCAETLTSPEFMKLRQETHEGNHPNFQYRKEFESYQKQKDSENRATEQFERTYEKDNRK